MQKFTGFIATIGLLSLLLVGAESWAPGSVPSCPAGDPPTCPINPSDDYDNLFNHPSDCHYFIHCDAGAQPICKECPADLHFNPTLHVCDWPANAGCSSGGGGDPTPTPTPAPGDECTTPEHGDCEECPGECVFECPECTCDDDRLPHPTECNWYYQCTKYVPELTKCPGGWVFNRKLKICDCPCHTLCKVDKCPTPECPTTEPPCTCPDTLGQALPVCSKSERPTFFAHPVDCEYYYTCIDAVPTCTRCSDGFHWNEDTKLCELPEKAGCLQKQLLKKRIFDFSNPQV